MPTTKGPEALGVIAVGQLLAAGTALGASVQGVVRNATDNMPIAGATVAASTDVPGWPTPLAVAALLVGLLGLSVFVLRRRGGRATSGIFGLVVAATLGLGTQGARPVPSTHDCEFTVATDASGSYLLTGIPGGYWHVTAHMD